MSTPQVATSVPPPAGMTGDMRFVGMFQIIIGAFSCISIIGAVVGVPMLISGLRAREAADAFAGYQQSRDPGLLARAFQGQAGYFKMQKIYAIVTICLIVLCAIFYAAIIAFVVKSGLTHSLPQ